MSSAGRSSRPYACLPQLRCRRCVVPGAGSRIGLRLQLRHGCQRHLVGHPGRRLAGRGHRKHPSDADRRGPERRFSTSINGFGGIKVLVDAAPAPRFNGELDARLRADLRRRRSIQDDSIGEPRRGDDLARDLHQSERQLGTLARYLHQHDEGADDDQGGVRRSVRTGRDWRQREHHRQHLQRRRERRPRRRVGRSGNTARYQQG